MLKFLIDNLDICVDEITVVKDEKGYVIYSDDKISKILSEENVIPSIIDLAPQKINLFFKEGSSAIDLLRELFNERIIENKTNFQNIQNFKISHQ